MSPFKLRLLIVVFFLVLGAQAYRAQPQLAKGTHIGIFLIVLVFGSLLSTFFLCKQKYKGIKRGDLKFPTLSGPLLGARLPMQDELDGALLTIATGLGGLLGIGLINKRLSYESLAAILWGGSMLMGIWLYTSRERISQ